MHAPSSRLPHTSHLSPNRSGSMSPMPPTGSIAFTSLIARSPQPVRTEEVRPPVPGRGLSAPPSTPSTGSIVSTPRSCAPCRRVRTLGRTSLPSARLDAVAQPMHRYGADPRSTESGYRRKRRRPSRHGTSRVIRPGFRGGDGLHDALLLRILAFLRRGFFSGGRYEGSLAFGGGGRRACAPPPRQRGEPPPRARAQLPGRPLPPTLRRWKVRGGGFVGGGRIRGWRGSDSSASAI